jgi:hypothetical protein
MSSKQFTRKIFCWLDQVNRDCELPPHAFKIAFGLSPDFNEDEGGMAWCGLDRLSTRSCTSKSTAHKMIGLLEARGHLRVEWGKRGNGGHPNRYWMVIKSESGDLFDHAAKVRQPANFESSQSTPPKVRETGVQSSYTRSQSSPARTESIEDSSKNHRGDKTLAPADASLDLKKKPQAEPEPEVATAFTDFWRVYPRKVGRDAAEAAFAKMIREGNGASVIIAGAQRYAIERRGEPERYTKFPVNWLNEKRGEDEPDGAVVVDQEGNVVGIEQPARRSRPDREKTWKEIGEELLAEWEAEEAAEQAEARDGTVH